MLVVILESFKCARPSQLAALYPLTMMFLLASRVRTLVLVGASEGALVALGTQLAGYTTLFAVLQPSTRSSLKSGQSLPPGDTSGLVSRYLVAWVLPVLLRGSRKPLDMDSLGAIDRNLWSAATWTAFQPQWDKQRSRVPSGEVKQPLLRACMLSFLPVLAAPLLPSLIYSVVSMARPLILLETVNFVQSFSTTEPDDIASGWGLVGATTLVYGIYAISYTLAHVAIKRASLAIRGALMEALYHKALVVRTETARELGAKSGNLMSVDIRLVVEALRSIHEVRTHRQSSCRCGRH